MKKPLGRPKKPVAAARGESMEIRVNPAEKQAFGLAAEIAGIGLSTWVRERLRLSAIRELEAAGCRVPFVDPVSLR